MHITTRISSLSTALLIACTVSPDSETECEPDVDSGFDSDWDTQTDSDWDSDSGDLCDADTTPVDCPERPVFRHPDPFVSTPSQPANTCEDPVVDNPVLVTEGDVETYNPDSDTDSHMHVEGRCSWPMEDCGTWSEQYERAASGRCLGSATLTGCAADRYVREGQGDVSTQYYAADGSLIAVHTYSDTEVGCADPARTTAWDAWRGPFIDDCVETEVKATAGCIPNRLSNTGGIRFEPLAASLDQAIAQVPTGCYGIALCEDVCGPVSVVFVQGRWRGDGDELQAAHYDLTGQSIDDVTTLPRDCRNAVLVPSTGCGLVEPSQ